MKALNNLIARIAILALVATSVWEIGASLTNAGEIDIPSFRKAALQKWEEMFNAADGYECSQVVKRIEDGTVVSETWSQFAMSFPCNCLESLEEDGNRKTVECRNSKYGFTLSKNATEDNWYLDSVQIFNRKLKRKRDWRMRNSASYNVQEDRLTKHYTEEEEICGLERMVQFSTTWGRLHPQFLLPCIIADPDFTIVSVTEIVDERGVSCYNVEFTYRSESEFNLFNVREGTIEFDRENFAVRRAVYQWGAPEYDGVKEVTLSYEKNDSTKFPLVTKKETKDLENGKLRFIEEIDYEYRPASDLTEDRFKLSYYGLEEPIFDDDFNFDTRWYFLIVGVAFVFIATLLGRRRKAEREETSVNDVTAD